MSSKSKKETKFKASQIPLESSLGLLAIGDVAFEQWREIKAKSPVKNLMILKKENDNEKK